MNRLSVVVVLLTFTFSFQSAFSEEHANPAGAEPHAAKSPDETGKDWSHKRQGQVAQIYPELGVNKAAVVRPEKVQLIAPAFLAKVSGGSVKLEWSETAGAQNYHIQVSKDAGFNNRSMYAAEEKFVAGTTFEVKNLEAGQKYFWRVAAHNKNQDSMYTKGAFTSSVFETVE